MFEVQWWAKATEHWAFRASYDSQLQAELKADASSTHFHVAHRIIEQPAGRVVAVFGSDGKRLTFPIAQAIAYVALAERMFSAGTEAGRAYQLGKCKHKEHKPR